MAVRTVGQLILFAAWRNKDIVASRLGAAQYLFCLEITMPKVNLSGMTVDALIEMRKRVDETLVKRRAEIEKRLERMDRATAVVDGTRVVRGGGSALKGRRVPAKYRGPKGETWAGRGVKPRWLVAAIKEGKKLDEFLIDKSVAVVRKKKRRRKNLRSDIFEIVTGVPTRRSV
jgi:DNA-binding protein H-NS